MQVYIALAIGFVVGGIVSAVATRRSIVVRLGPNVELQAGTVRELTQVLAALSAAGTLAHLTQEPAKGQRVQ